MAVAPHGEMMKILLLLLPYFFQAMGGDDVAT
jgi:hypothetical protein